MRYAALALLCLFTLAGIAARAETLDDDLIYRINFGRSEDVELLLAKGANANARSDQGDSALSLAVGRNDPDAVVMVEALLKKGANPNLPDKYGNRPIMVAARNGQAQMVADLMHAGADFRITSSTGTSLLEVARTSADPKTAIPIQTAIDEEKVYSAGLRTKERFKSLVSRYVYASCQNEYWAYLLNSRQDPSRDEEVGQKMKDSEAELWELMKEVERYYPKTTVDRLQGISNAAASKLANKLDSMVSNRFRERKGVGTEADLQKRCNDMVDTYNLRPF